MVLGRGRNGVWGEMKREREVFPGDYVYTPSDSTTGLVPGFNGGYFPPFIFELFSRIVCSLTESFSSDAVVGTRFCEPGTGDFLVDAAF